MRKLAMDQFGVVNQTSFKNQEFTDVKEIDPRQNFIKDQIECGAESQVQISSKNQELLVVKSQSKAIDLTQKIIIDPIKYEAVKGHLISKCPFGVFKSSIKATNFFQGFLP